MAGSQERRDREYRQRKKRVGPVWLAVACPAIICRLDPLFVLSGFYGAALGAARP